MMFLSVIGYSVDKNRICENVWDNIKLELSFISCDKEETKKFIDTLKDNLGVRGDVNDILVENLTKSINLEATDALNNLRKIQNEIKDAETSLRIIKSEKGEIEELQAKLQGVYNLVEEFAPEDDDIYFDVEDYN